MSQDQTTEPGPLDYDLEGRPYDIVEIVRPATVNQTPPQRITNGPQILCRICGEISNHITGLCATHRAPDNLSARVYLTDADRAYLRWRNENHDR